MFCKCYYSVKRKVRQGSRLKIGRRSTYRSTYRLTCRSTYRSGYRLKERGGLGRAIEHICRSIIEVTDYKVGGRGVKTVDFHFLFNLCFSLQI